MHVACQAEREEAVLSLLMAEFAEGASVPDKVRVVTRERCPRCPTNHQPTLLLAQKSIRPLDVSPIVLALYNAHFHVDDGDAPADAGAENGVGESKDAPSGAQAGAQPTTGEPLPALPPPPPSETDKRKAIREIVAKISDEEAQAAADAGAGGVGVSPAIAVGHGSVLLDLLEEHENGREAEVSLRMVEKVLELQPGCAEQASGVRVMGRCDPLVPLGSHMQPWCVCVFVRLCACVCACVCVCVRV